MKKYIRPDLREFTPYQSARREASGGQILLNANESPYQDFENDFSSARLSLNRYPDPQPQGLRQRLAEIYQVTPEQLLMTRGIDEGIDLLIRLCCQAGQDQIIITPPTFGMYAVSAKLQNAAIIKVPLLAAEDFKLNTETLLVQRQSATKVIFICSPNNPTGNCIPITDILKICQACEHNSLVFVDEAYIEFSDQPSALPFLNQCANLVIARTLSKAYGLAGARLGVMLAHPEIIHYLSSIIAPYPLATINTTVITAELSTQRLQRIHEQINTIKQQRIYLTAQDRKSVV